MPPRSGRHEIARASRTQDRARRVNMIRKSGHRFSGRPCSNKVKMRLSLSSIQSCWEVTENRAMLVPDARFVSIDLWDFQHLLRSRVALEAEILVLRQQINVLRRANPKRLRFVSIDGLIL